MKMKNQVALRPQHTGIYVYMYILPEFCGQLNVNHRSFMLEECIPSPTIQLS
jgi:hypothetical protein